MQTNKKTVFHDILTYTVGLPDYCYTFNIPTMKWTQHNLIAPAGFNGPRTYHSGRFSLGTSLKHSANN